MNRILSTLPIAVVAVLVYFASGSVCWAADEKQPAVKNTGLSEGDLVPAFESIDDSGQAWKSSDHVGKGVLVLYFYPFDFTGGCVKQAEAYRDGLVEDNPTAYVEKNFFKLDEPRNGIGSTFPVIAGGCLYLRDNDRLYKYDVSQRSVDAVLPEPRVITMAKPEQSKRQPLPAGERGAKAIFVPTPMDVVAKMLEIAKVGKEDVVVDLGSGDGRILIEAAKTHGCRAIGIEIDPELVKISKQRIQDASLNDRVAITEADLFETDFGDATVVTAYLYSDLLKRVLPKFEKLKPGSRIVTHQFAIPDISPDETVRTVSQETGAEHTIYLWTTPLLKSPKKD